MIEPSPATMDILKGLAHPVRLDIFRMFFRSDGRILCAAILRSLQEKRKISQPAVSQHLQKMVRLGLLKKTRKGRHFIYELQPHLVVDMRQLFKQLLKDF